MKEPQNCNEHKHSDGLADSPKVNNANSSEDKYDKLTYGNLRREEVIRKRKERNKNKKEAKTRERETKLLEENLLKKKSEKIKTVKSEDFKKIQTLQAVAKRQPKFRKVEKFNILDFIISKSENQKKLKLLNINKKEPKKIINRGKKRENKVKVIRSRLKKAIIEARITRKELSAKNLESVVVKDSLEDSQNSNSYEVVDSKLKTSNNEKLNIELSQSVDDAVNKLQKLNIIEKSNELAKIHSRRFRSYCDNITSSILRELTEELIRKIYFFQKRAFQKNEIKAKAHRRYVMGFKETKRGLSTGKIKLVIISPDCEKCETSDGIEETIEWIKNKCNENEVPYLFSLRARQIAYCLYIKVPINCLGILNYEGVQNVYNDIVTNLAIERENYLKLVKNTNTK